jgi:anti-anti-sigma regulatory factor
MEKHETGSLIRLEGESGVTAAAEWKQRLLEGLAGGGDLQLDLEGLAEVDVTLLQLLAAAGREAECSGARIIAQLSPAASAAARDAGFERLPGLRPEGRTDG